MFHTARHRRHRTTRLCLCILAACGLDAAHHSALAAPTTRFVTTCIDDVNQAGSLRAVVNASASGDVVDLSQLSCSLITLAAGEVLVGQDNLTIADPSRRAGGQQVAISGNHASRVLRHLGSGTLSLGNVAIVSGREVIDQLAFGGCIYSNGSVSLDDVTVHDCVLSATYLVGGTVKGGGIFARGAVSLSNGSSVLDNKAYGASVSGGGVYATTGFTATASAIAGNQAYADKSVNYVNGGGVFVKGGPVAVKYSTISHNTAGVLGNGNMGFGGGMHLATPSSVMIANSTVYGNTANVGAGINSYRNTTVSNSTIANNRAITRDAGIRVQINQLTLNSSIVSHNTTGADAATAVEDDVALRYGGTWSPAGQDNLVMASNVVPPPNEVRLTVDPQLGTLASNGGPVGTMLPSPGSVVRNAGNNANAFSFEQRGGKHYPRSGGGLTDIGAVQYDNLFGDGFE